jgi:hypothetical protein
MLGNCKRLNSRGAKVQLKLQSTWAGGQLRLMAKKAEWASASQPGLVLKQPSRPGHTHPTRSPHVIGCGGATTDGGRVDPV